MPSARNTPPPQYTPPEAPTKRNNISRAVAKIITDNFLDDFKTVVLKHDPNLKGSKEVDAWRQKKAEEIYDMIKAREGVFASVPVTVPGLAKKDIAAIRRVFTNRAHHVIKPKVGATESLTKTSTNPSSSNVSKATMMSSKDARKIIDTVLQLSSTSSGRSLFRLSKHAEIDNLSKSETITVKGDNPGGRYQAAAKMLWDGLEPEERVQWEENARKQTDNIAENQAALKIALEVLFHALAKSGRVGSIECFVMLALRSPDAELVTQQFNAGTSGKEYHKTWMVGENDETYVTEHFEEIVLRPFMEWANLVIPGNPLKTHFTEDERGYPIFPQVDVMQCTGEELVAYVQTFLELLWEKQHNGESLSWEDVSRSPMNFYDKQKFDLPIKFSHPRNMGAGVFIFAEYLKGPGSLFRFLEQTARNEEKAVAPTPIVVPSQLSSTAITTSTPAAAPSQPSSTTVVAPVPAAVPSSSLAAERHLAPTSAVVSLPEPTPTTSSCPISCPPLAPAISPASHLPLTPTISPASSASQQCSVGEHVKPGTSSQLPDSLLVNFQASLPSTTALLEDRDPLTVEDSVEESMASTTAIVKDLSPEEDNVPPRSTTPTSTGEMLTVNAEGTESERGR
ncbi:hypothetical protein BT96DRAFT_1026893, partial [Gymnopus androsaceus JB14]